MYNLVNLGITYKAGRGITYVSQTTVVILGVCVLSLWIIIKISVIAGEQCSIIRILTTYVTMINMVTFSVRPDWKFWPEPDCYNLSYKSCRIRPDHPKNNFSRTNKCCESWDLATDSNDLAKNLCPGFTKLERIAKKWPEPDIWSHTGYVIIPTSTVTNN